jgi:hypothetical protein
MYHTITFSIHVRSRTILKSRLTSLSLNAYAHLGESTKHTNYFLVPKKWQNLSKSLPVIQVIMYRKVNRFLEVLFNLISSRATSRKICLNRPHNFQVNVKKVGSCQSSTQFSYVCLFDNKKAKGSFGGNQYIPVVEYWVMQMSKMRTLHGDIDGS